MKQTAIFPTAICVASLFVAGSTGGCGTQTTPRDLMMEEATKQGVERPVAMRGETAFLEGKVAAVVTVSRGFDRGTAGGPARGKGRGLREDEISGRNRRDEAGAFAEVYNIGGYGTSEEDQKEAIAEYMRQARARRAAGSPMPPVTLRVLLENRGTEPLELEVTEVNSSLGNFAVRPPKLTLAPGEKGLLEPMVSQLGVTSDEIPLKLAVRTGGKKEEQVVTVKNVFAGAARREAGAP
jgi:hypothetical protein